MTAKGIIISIIVGALAFGGIVLAYKLNNEASSEYLYVCATEINGIHGKDAPIAFLMYPHDGYEKCAPGTTIYQLRATTYIAQ